ncbi:MAG: ArnT family glycosyltransferase [Bacteroidota bacterium]
MRSDRRKYLPALLFLILMLAVAVIYDYQGILMKRPMSVHRWRQADCASIALNYYQGGMRFFEPETHNLTSDGGTSGKGCTSEVPLLYYAVALLYKVFGYHEEIYRILNTLLFFLGLFYLFRIISYLIKDTFWALAAPLLFFASPVLAYYGNNFLSNTPAFAFSVASWFYFIRFTHERSRRNFLLSMLFILIAGSFKITALFSFFVFAGIWLTEATGVLRFSGNNRLFTKPVSFVLPFFAVLVLSGLWIGYASWYNARHDCSYFSTTVFPLWNTAPDEVARVVHNVRKIWFDQYFHPVLHLFFFIALSILLIFFRRTNRVFLAALIILITEMALYILLQFWTFADHDYYTIDLFILPVIILVALLDLGKRCLPSIMDSWIVRLLFVALIVFNVIYTRGELNNRYNGKPDQFGGLKDIYTLSPFLDQIGVLPGDTVISLPDNSNASLYLMNRKGWTAYTDARFNRGTPVHYNQDSAGIAGSRSKGAKYLILNGIEWLYRYDYLRPFCTHLTARRGSVLIFNLRDTNVNFSLPERIPVEIFRCGAERLCEDKKFFLGEPDSTLFSDGQTRDGEEVHSGFWSSRLAGEQRFGLTLHNRDLINGESFRITVWRKNPEGAAGGPVASCASGGYYNSTFQVLEKEESGWEKLGMEVFVTAEMSGSELISYVYNPSGIAVWYDDLEIIRYGTVLEEEPALQTGN